MASIKYCSECYYSYKVYCFGEARLTCNHRSSKNIINKDQSQLCESCRLNPSQCGLNASWFKSKK